MNEIVNKFLLVGNKFMPEMHSRQPGFTYSACRPFTKSKERIQKFLETGDSQYIYQNELDKACFQHGMAYGDFKDLARRTAPDKVLHDKAFNVTKNPKTDGLVDLLQWFSNFLIKKCLVVVLKIRISQTQNELKNCTNQLLENLKIAKDTKLL